MNEPDFEASDSPEAVASVEAPETAEAPSQSPAAPAAKAWSDEEEADARVFGWKRPDEWQGDKPPGFIDNPKEFLARVERSRIFQGMNQKLAEKEAAAEERIRRIEAMTDKALQAQRAAFERQLSDIEARKRAAVGMADEAAYDRLEKERAGLIREAQRVLAPPQPPQAPQRGPVDPEVASYAKTAAWMQNPALIAQGAFIVEHRPDIKAMPQMEQVKAVERELSKMYPSFFQTAPSAAPAAPRPQTVDGGGLAGGASRAANSFDRLPPEAKSAFKKFAAQGLFPDNEQGRKAYTDEYLAS